MKWNISRWLLLWLLPLCGLFGCSTTRTTTTTRTTYKLDTIYKVQLDFKNLMVSKPLDNFLHGDTIRAENHTSVAMAYYNVSTQRVELSLRGKLFDVPVQLQATKIEKIKQVEKPVPWWLWFIIGTLISFILFRTLTK